MVDFIWVKALVKTLVLPPTGLLLVAVLGLAICARFPRVGRAFATTGVVLLLLLSVPVAADLLVQFLDTYPPLDLVKASEAKAIVILGSGVRRDSPEYDGDTLGSRTLERVRYGARVARLTGLPVLVSGGSVLGGAPEAMLMRTSLEEEFAVPVQWAEARSRTTHENAVWSAEILRNEGIHRVVLVAHAVDMRRAVAEFAAEGIEAIPAPTVMRTPGPYTLLDYLPSMAGLQQSYWAMYEIFANMVWKASSRWARERRASAGVDISLDSTVG